MFVYFEAFLFRLCHGQYFSCTNLSLDTLPPASSKACKACNVTCWENCCISMVYNTLFNINVFNVHNCSLWLWFIVS